MRGFPDPDPGIPEDGLHRLIVRPSEEFVDAALEGWDPDAVAGVGPPPAPEAEDPWTTVPGPEPSIDQQSPEVGPSTRLPREVGRWSPDSDRASLWTLTPEQLAGMGEGSSIVFRDGVPGYVDTRGRFVALESATVDVPDPTSDVADPVVDVADATSDVADPVVDVADATSDVADPVVDVADATSDVADPVVDVADATADVADPVVDVADPSSDVADPASTPRVVPATAPGPLADPVVERLLSIKGVQRAVEVGEGVFAIITTRRDLLDPDELDVTEDLPLSAAADPLDVYQWALDNTGDNLSDLPDPPLQTSDADIDGAEVAEEGRGAEVVVAVIDTGVDFSHPDLTRSRWINEDETCGNLVDDDRNGIIDDCWGWDFGNGDHRSWDGTNDPHGTQVAGVIAAGDNQWGMAGLAPAARIMDLNVSGPGGVVTISSVARAVRYAADNGARVINISLATAPDPEPDPAAVQPLVDAVEHAGRAGSVVVVAAGNHAADLDRRSVFPASIDAAHVLTVAASTPTDSPAWFTNHGGAVDLFAPGELVLSTVPGKQWRFADGTSMSSAVVAGAVASMLSDDPLGQLTTQSISNQLIGTADDPQALLGLAANPVRLNLARAMGVEADPTRAEVRITGLAHVEPDRIVDIEVVDPGEFVDEPHVWEATLVRLDADGAAHGVIGHPVTVGWERRGTGGRGAVDLGFSGSGKVRIRTTLPSGSYGLVLEAVPTDDPSVRLGDAFVATFVVGEPSAPVPTVPLDGRPPSSSTTTSAAPPSSTGPPPTVPVSTTAPAPSPSSSEVATTRWARVTTVATTATTTVGNGYSVTDLTPDRLVVDSSTSVSLFGGFPDPVEVWFGDQLAPIVHRSASWLVVEAPPSDAPGPVGVSLRSPDGEVVLMVTDGFRYLEAETPAPTSTSTPIGTPGSTTTTAEPSSTVPPAPETSTTEAAPTTGATAPVDAIAPAERRPRAVAGPYRSLDSGLRVVPMPALEAVAQIPFCISSPCGIRRLS